MNKKLIILLSGKKKTGKTFLSKEILKRFPGEIHSFATELKEMCHPFVELFGIDVKDPEQKELIRDLYQVGGSIGRMFHFENGLPMKIPENSSLPSFWIQSLHKDIQNSNSNIILIDDARFRDELISFDNNNNFKVLKVRLEDFEKQINNYDDDISENELDEWSREPGRFDLVLPARPNDTFQATLFNQIEKEIKFLSQINKPKTM